MFFSLFCPFHQFFCLFLGRWQVHIVCWINHGDICPFNQFFPDLFGTTFGVMHPSQNSDWNSFSLQLCKSIASICQCCVPCVQYQCVALRLRQHLSCDQAYYSLSVRLCHYLGIWGMAAGRQVRKHKTNYLSTKLTVSVVHFPHIA